MTATSERRGERRRRRHLSIRLVLAVATGGLVAVAVLGVLWIQLASTRDTTLDLLSDNLALAVRSLTRELQLHLEPAVAQAEFLANRLEAHGGVLTEQAALAPFIAGALAATPQVEAIVVLDRSLQELVVWQDSDRQVRADLRDRSEDAVIQQVMFEMTANTDGHWGRLVFGEGTTYLNYRRPLLRDGEVVGGLIVAVSVQELSLIATDIGRSLGMTPFVLLGSDKVLAHPNLASAHPMQSRDSPAVPLDALGDPMLQRLWEAEPVTAFASLRQQGISLVRHGFEEQAYYAVYTWLNDYGNLPWGVGAWDVLDSESNPFERMRRAGLAGLAVLAIAVLFAILLGGWLGRPIRRAAAESVKIGRLELADVEPLPASQIREIDDQAVAFNTMLTGLHSFERYVPRPLVRRLIRSGAGEEIPSEERQVTVMFTDIVGFTSRSESMSAGEVAAFLNEHFTLLEGCIERQEGTVDKFIGDGLMAFWGAPEPQPDAATRACRAAMAIAEAVAGNNARRESEGEASVQLRIGIHSGPVVVGNIGAPGRINYTIVGDTVNTCQRIEGLGREQSGSGAVNILLSEQVAKDLNDSFALERIGHFAVKGRREEILVYRLRSPDDGAAGAAG